MKYIIICPQFTMRSTATGRSGGIAVFIADDTTDLKVNSDGRREWHLERAVALPHIPFDGRKMFHSPDGFQIGYDGSGPADLALAICHLFQKDNLYPAFKHFVIAKLDRKKQVEMSFDSIKFVLARIEKELFN